MRTEQEIRADLDVRLNLRFEIADRVTDKAQDVYDLKDNLPLTEERINARTKWLAQEIVNKYPNAMPVLVNVLDGAQPFVSKLCSELDNLDYNYECTGIQASSYGAGMTSGTVKVQTDFKAKMGNRLVIVCDEVADTGKTFGALRDILLDKGAKEVSFVVLVDKKQPRAKEEFNPTFSCFTIDHKEFIIGSGLDYLDGLMRNKHWVKKVDFATLPTKEEQKLLDEINTLNSELQQCIAEKKATATLEKEATYFSENGAVNSFFAYKSDTSGTAAQSANITCN